MDKHTIDLLKRINKCDKIDEVRDLIIDFVTDDSLVKEHNYDLPEDRVFSICSVDSHGTKIWKNKNGQYHRTDGPACEYLDGAKYWYLNGEHHRTDGPAIELANGSKSWFMNGFLHRTDGPAIEFAAGRKEWYLNDRLHRTDGPAIEDTNGSKSWFMNGFLHRTDGPAIEDADGSKEWYLSGKRLTKQEHKLRTTKINLPEDRVFSICSVDNFGNETWKNKDGLYHRTDGPAIKFADGEKSWWLNGTKMTEQEHRNRVYKWKDKQF